MLRTSHDVPPISWRGWWVSAFFDSGHSCRCISRRRVHFVESVQCNLGFLESLAFRVSTHSQRSVQSRALETDFFSKLYKRFLPPAGQTGSGLYRPCLAGSCNGTPSWPTRATRMQTLPYLSAVDTLKPRWGVRVGFVEGKNKYFYKKDIPILLFHIFIFIGM